MNIFVPQVFPFHMFPDINSSHKYLTFVCPYIEVIIIMIFVLFWLKNCEKHICKCIRDIGSTAQAR